jgi:UDPglucose 6-dehydrogenase
MRITIVGTGYVGLVTGACFAELGHDVICVDKDEQKIDSLKNGAIPIYEPGLENLVSRNVAAGRLAFSLDLGGSVKGRDTIFIAVGTPSEAGSGRADLTHVYAAAAEIASELDQFCVIVTKSTVPVGTNRKIAKLTASLLAPGVSVAVASNPEFLREGAAIADFMKPDRIVVGAEDPRAVAVLEELYLPLVARGFRLMRCGLESAEIVKYAANAFLAVKVTFMNEVADLCEAVEADVEAVAMGIGADRRIGPEFLRVGPGWGGSCFPKDTRALVSTAHENDVRLKVVEACIEANHDRKVSMADRVESACGNSLSGKRIAVLGLTFKGQTDDMRESPSLDLVAGLHARGATIRAYDPSSPSEAPRLLPEVRLVDSPQSAAAGADALVIATDWQEFAGYDLGDLADRMADPVMVDLRNMFEADAAIKSGFRRYAGLGRAAENAPSLGLIAPAFGAPSQPHAAPVNSIEAAE